MLSDQVHTVGTVRTKRGEAKEVCVAGNKDHKLMKGELVAKDNGKVMTICWMDKKPVCALSTKHDGSMKEITKRKKGGDGEMEKIFKPVCICDYNKHMSGVDIMDQMISYYPFTRKGYKWCKKLLLYLFEISIHNAHILYNLRGNKMPLYGFHLAIVKGLCMVDDVSLSSEDSKSNPNPVLRSPIHDPPSRLVGGHKKPHLELIPGTNRTLNPQKCCQICYCADI